MTQISLSDETLDRLARRIAEYLRKDEQRQRDRELAAEHRRFAPGFEYKDTGYAAEIRRQREDS